MTTPSTQLSKAYQIVFSQTGRFYAPAMGLSDAFLSRVESFSDAQSAPTPMGPQGAYALSLLSNLQSLGATLEPAVVCALSYERVANIGTFYNLLLPQLSQQLGAHRTMQPMYPNFPSQVANATDSELLANAFSHYAGDASGVRFMPRFETVARPKEQTEIKLKTLGLSDQKAPLDLAIKMVSSPVALSTSMRLDLSDLVAYLASPDAPTESAISAFVAGVQGATNRENIAHTAHILSKNGHASEGLGLLTLSTDVLRYAQSKVDGDASLAALLPFGSFSRSERRALVGVLNTHAKAQPEQMLENLFERRENFLRLFERLHPSEFKQFDVAGEAIARLRAKDRPQSFASQVQAQLKEANPQVIDLLATRPGELVRSATRLIVSLPESAHAHLVAKFTTSISGASTNVLIQARQALRDLWTDGPRAEDAVRIFMPKGGIAKMYVQNPSVKTPKKVATAPQVPVAKPAVVIQSSLADALAKALAQNPQAVPTAQTPPATAAANDLPSDAATAAPASAQAQSSVAPAKIEHSSAVIQAVAKSLLDALDSVLVARFSAFEPLGKCYVEPQMEQVYVPFAARSAVRSAQSLARGSRMDAQAETVRFFLYWSQTGKTKEGAPLNCGRTDIDLSCVMYDKDYKTLGHVSWGNLRSGQAIVHSGDITSAPNGASEFIDVNYDKLDANVAYIALTVNSFSSQTFDELPECFVGMMKRNSPQSGEIFEPTTVATKSDLTSPTTTTVPLVIDVANRQGIWADITLGKGSGWNIASTQAVFIGQMIQAVVEVKKTSIADLFDLHIKARGERVDRPEDANLVIGFSGGLKPYDFTTLSSQFLVDTAPTVALPKELFTVPLNSQEALAETGCDEPPLAPSTPSVRPKFG